MAIGIYEISFWRESARNSTAGKQSTGLGLPIVKRLVTEHHGKVGAISEVGTGSVFWFRIPA
jgi:signal transduction histidine kinase